VQTETAAPVRTKYLADVVIPLEHLRWLWGRRRTILQRRAVAYLKLRLSSLVASQLGARWASAITARKRHARRWICVEVVTKKRTSKQFLAWLGNVLVIALGRNRWYADRRRLRVSVRVTKNDEECVHVYLRKEIR